MNDERVVEQIITKFLLNTTRLRPQLTKPAVQAAMICFIKATHHPVNDEEVDFIPLTTGSVAEFYIEPMLPHIGDVDVMFHWSTDLAIPRGHAPLTQLPAEFHNYVKVMEFIDSHLPGYVYLEARYLLTECVDDGKYNAVEYDRHMYLSNRCYTSDVRGEIHGPAICAAQSGFLSCDDVRCVRCLVWPSQAADWPTRHRNYGWPDSATVDRVVNNGCDVVPVAHRQCKQHEWMGKHQWRLSFSRAEIVLINSWMPVQQIVYHVLRVFMKTERLTDSANNTGTGSLSNYHIKTLMLWACELKSQTWWTDELNIVRICIQLLHILADWLTDGRCQHYFINNCNLIDNSFNMTNIAGQLMSIDETWLSTWFVDNYIRKCSQLCPDNISRLFDDVSTTLKLQDAVSAVVAWRLSNSTLDAWVVHKFLWLIIASSVDNRSLTARSCSYLMSELSKIDSRLCVYITAVAFLHVAYRSLRRGLKDELMNILATIFGQFIGRRRYCSNSTSSLSIDQAAKLMKVVANKPLSTMSLIAIELSKAYLYGALRCKDSDSDSIYCLANVYLAVLYYTTGDYHTAIDHCTLVMRSQDHSQCSSHVVQGELLPKIDDDIDNVLGLAVLYQHIRTAALNQQHQTQHVSVFTTELFAHYLHLKYLSFTEFLPATLCRQFTPIPSCGQLKQYKICIMDTEQLFISDVLLFMSLRRLLKNFYHEPVCQQSHQPTMNQAEHKASDLVELLQQSAVEHLTAFRQIEARDFGSVATIVTTDFEAMYAYKRGDYQQCLQLSTQNVRCLLYAVDMPSVSLLPEFIQLLDDDIVSLTALPLIVNPKCRDHGRYVIISQLTLSLYLMTQCQLKLRHSVMSLARTLDYIEVAHRRHPVKATLDRLTLKMIAQKAVTYITTMMNNV